MDAEHPPSHARGEGKGVEEVVGRVPHPAPVVVPEDAQALYWGLGFRVWGLWFGVWGSRLRVAS